jgi:predicted DNA-binding WGR domain protein
MSRREFHFQEGSSQKFWAIDVNGTSSTVQFGRLGTAGQTQTKEFADEAAAQKAADKLIAEKTKKGYVEVGGAPAPAPDAAAPVKGKKKPQPPATQTSENPAQPPEPRTQRSERRIDLDPRDWLWATWRPRQPLPKPGAPAAFDQENAVERFAGAVKAEPNLWMVWKWLRFKTPPSREEAHFWFALVISNVRVSKSPEKVARELGRKTYDGNITAAEVVASLRARKQHFSDDDHILTQLLSVLLTPAELIELTLGDLPEDFWRLRLALREVILKEVLPRLAAEELEPIKKVLRPLLNPKKYPADFELNEQPAFRFAAAVGMSPEMEAVVSRWPDGRFASEPWATEPQWMLFGLGDPREVDRHMRRVKLPVGGPEHARAWLAHTEYAGLDFLRDGILAATVKPWIENLVKVFCLVKAPEAAPHLLELRAAGKAPNLIGAWLDENRAHAVAGLIPAAAGKGKLADAAVEHLRTLKKTGHADLIAEQLNAAPADVAEKVRAAVFEHEEKVYEPIDAKTTPKPLRDALTASATAKALPPWAAPALLPPIVVGERRLIEVQVSAVLGALRETTLGSATPMLAALKAHADPLSLDAFAWNLFERWLTEGAASKEKWAMLAIGHLGGDGCALKLTPLVRAWPGESQHARAVVGLECLRAIGSDAALMQLNGIAQKLKFQGLKNKAQEFMEEIAKARGLSRDELDDLIVPDLGLDERGSRVFDFGPRQFTVGIDAELTPVVRDGDGKVKADLPKPGASDNKWEAEAAVAEWKLLKKLLREALKLQATRLEQAMVTARRWPPERFEALIVKHPLMTLLARRLLWGGYDKKGELVATFRVTEDQQCFGPDEKPFALKGLASVGVVHPLHLTPEQRAKWGEVFGDYEIITPFPQFDRPVFAPDKEEAKATEITRLAKAKVPQQALRGTLERHGWVRGSSSDHGVVQDFFKQFPGAGLTVIADVEPGIALGLPDYTEDQKVNRVYFREGLFNTQRDGSHLKAKPLALRKVDPVTLSEVLADLAEIASKAKG